jgi:hypothetical protein
MGMQGFDSALDYSRAAAPVGGKSFFHVICWEYVCGCCVSCCELLRARLALLYAACS